MLASWISARGAPLLARAGCAPRVRVRAAAVACTQPGDAAAEASAAARHAAFGESSGAEMQRRAAIISLFTVGPAPLRDALTEEIVAGMQGSWLGVSTTKDSVKKTLKAMVNDGKLFGARCKLGRTNSCALVFAPTQAAADEAVSRRVAAHDAAAAAATAAAGGASSAATRAAVVALFRSRPPALTDASSREVAGARRKRGVAAPLLHRALRILCERGDLCRSPPSPANQMGNRYHVYALSQSVADAGVERRGSAWIDRMAAPSRSVAARAGGGVPGGAKVEQQPAIGLPAGVRGPSDNGSS